MPNKSVFKLTALEELVLPFVVDATQFDVLNITSTRAISHFLLGAQFLLTPI